MVGFDLVGGAVGQWLMGQCAEGQCWAKTRFDLVGSGWYLFDRVFNMGGGFEWQGIGSGLRWFKRVQDAAM